MENFSSDTKVTEATLISTKEAAEILGVSTSTLKNWRERKLFGVPFFTADVMKNGAWFYERERVEQLKAVYQKGILQNMYKLARHFDEVCLFDICDSSGKPKKNFLEGMEVADILGVTEMTLTKWRKERKNLQPDFIGHEGTYFYSAARVMNYMSNKNSKAQSETLAKNFDKVQDDNCDVLRPSITDDDVVDIIRMSRDEQDALKLKIRQLDLRRILPLDKQGYGVVCPICGNGSGHTGDGVTVNLDDSDGHFWYHCFKCGNFEGDLINIIATVNGLDASSFFYKILAIGKKLLELAENSSVKPAAITKTRKSYSDEQISFFKNFREKFQANIDQLPLEDRRALTVDTFQHFHCGYDPLTKRIIIPTGDFSCNAILINSQRKFFVDNGVDYDKCLNYGSKALFNPSAIVPNKPIIVVEGEIDAMSIWQASGVNVCAIGGTSNTPLITFIAEHIPVENRKDYTFLVMLDIDSAGKDAAKKLTEDLINCGCPAVSEDIVSSSVKIDANDILIQNGSDSLKACIDSAISKFNDKIDDIRKKLSDPPADKTSNKNVIDDKLFESILYHPYTDAGNADRFLDFYFRKGNKKVAYLQDIGRWAVYESPVWKIAADKSNTIAVPHFITMARKIRECSQTKLKKVEEEMKTADDEVKQDKIAKRHNAIARLSCYAKEELENRKRYNPALDAAKGFYNLNFSDMDQQHNLLNTPSGVVDLCTGELHPHKAGFHFTQCTDADYCKGYRNDDVEQFLRDILPDDETRAALLRFLGYCLSGSVREEKAMFWTGDGGNGKSTLSQFFQKILNCKQFGYATSLRVDALLQATFTRDGNAPTPEFAKLEGKRLAVADEVPPNRKLDEGTFKSLTGGDYISARRLNCDPTEFEPHFKLIISGNHLPVISDGNDYSLRRRIMVVRFTEQFTDETRNTQLKCLLNAPDAKRGFLSVLVDECIKWHKEGLIESAAMKETKEQWLNDSQIFSDEDCQNFSYYSIIRDFLNKRCILDETSQIKCTTVYAGFRKDNPNVAISDRALKQYVEKISKGKFEFKHYRDGNYFVGLGWKNSVKG